MLSRSLAMLCLMIVATATTLLLTGCKTEGGYTRGLFSGYVLEKSQDEVADKVGKPDQTDASSPDTLRWVYRKKTFDPENNNQLDHETTVIFQKDDRGNFKATEILYS